MTRHVIRASGVRTVRRGALSVIVLTLIDPQTSVLVRTVRRYVVRKTTTRRPIKFPTDIHVVPTVRTQYVQYVQDGTVLVLYGKKQNKAASDILI